MKRIIIIVIGLLSASPVSAQSWSPGEQGVIDQIKRCNDAWVESIAWTVVPHSGESRRNPSHRLTVFRRVNGLWLMAGGTIAAAAN